jgi:hypothetical protein
MLAILGLQAQAVPEFVGMITAQEYQVARVAHFAGFPA